MTERVAAENIRVLVVEDDAELRSVLRRLIESMGLAADESDNAGDAIEMVAGDPGIGIVLLDLGLPPHPHDVSEGIRFLLAMREIARPYQVIVLSGQAEAMATRLAIENGATDFLPKPFDAALLKQSLVRAQRFQQVHGEMLGNSKVPIYLVADAATEGAGTAGFPDMAMEKLIRMVLADTHHNVSEAARRLGISREHLYHFIKRFNISRPKS